MDKKRAAIVASASVGLLVSAMFLRKMTRKRRNQDEEIATRAVVHAEERIPNTSPDPA